MLLPVLAPRGLSAALHVQAPRTAGARRSVNGRLAAARGRWARTARRRSFAIPAAVLFRGDNLLTLAARDGAPGARLRRVIVL